MPVSKFCHILNTLTSIDELLELQLWNEYDKKDDKIYGVEEYNFWLRLEIHHALS
jgi:hypothetical protein